MNNEFKKSKSNNETRYTLESMTAGATGSGSIATATGSVGKVQKRSDNILAQEAGKEKEAPKPRNFVAKNAKMGGAGKMQDKSKTIPRKEKHKKPVAEGFNGEYDDEAGMAHSNLLTTARAVMGLLKTIKDRDNLPEWGQEKIAKAEMMLVSVWDYLQSQKELGNDPQQGVAEGSMDEIHSIVSRMMGKYIDGYRDGRIDPDHLGAIIHKVAEKVSQQYGMDQNDAMQLVGDYVEGEVGDDVQNDGSFEVTEKAPQGWEGTVKAMKKHDNIDNPFALAWSMKNKGYKSHKKESNEYFESLENMLAELKKKK